MATVTRFQAMPLMNAVWYDPVRSNILPDIQPPSAMPSMLHMMTAPTRVPASRGVKCSRTIIAYAGTMPP